jgi:hypothetical protein
MNVNSPLADAQLAETDAFERYFIACTTGGDWRKACADWHRAAEKRRRASNE